MALYLLGLVGFRLRGLGTPLWSRLATIIFVATIVVLLELEPIVVHLPDVAAAAILTATCPALLVVELVVLRKSRDALHDAIFGERAAHEARETKRRRERYQ